MDAHTAHCPACKRYVGPAGVCPYCDVDVPIPRVYRLFKTAAWLLATVGLLLLWFAVRQHPPKTLPIADLDPAMNFARLQFEGRLTRPPRISRSRRSASTEVDDGSGRNLRIVFLDQALETLINRETPLPAGTPVRVQGSVSIRADEQPLIFLRDPEQFKLLDELP